MDLIGKSPLPVPLLLLGKTGLIGSPLFVLVKACRPDLMIFDNAICRTLGLIFYVGGVVILLTAIRQLGRSIAVGLPSRSTELKTDGLYGWSRNPIYFAAYVIGIGSCLIAVHPVNILLLATGMVVHRKIIRKEEKFLADRFGSQWREYCARVPRYIGIVHRLPAHPNSRNV